MRQKSLTVLFSFFFVFFAFLSCQSSPERPEEALIEGGYVPLEPGASAYIVVNAEQAKPILEQLNLDFAQNKQFQQMLDRTNFAIAAVYPSASPQQFQISAWGKYPASIANMSMSAKNGWSKIRSPETGKQYRYSDQNSLSIVLNAKQAFIAGGGKPVYPVAAKPGAAIPEAFGVFSKNAILSCWFDDPAPMINVTLMELKIPVEMPAEKLFISVFPAGDASEGRYEAFLRVEVATATQARALAAVMSLAGAFIPRDTASEIKRGSALLTAVFFENPPVNEGSILTIKTGLLKPQEIALLFNMFSVK